MVFVISKSGKPLMPTSNHGLIRKYLKSGKAKVHSKNPFTVKLLANTKEVVQPLYLGIDPGRTNVGYSIIDVEGKAILSGELVTRNKKIPKLMKARKEHRHKHRKFARQKQQRKAMRNHTSFGEKERFLPHYEKPITCKHIKNSEARYCNRKRPMGWLTPTANHLRQTHVNLVLKLMKLLPIKAVALELNKFAFMAMENPNIQKWEYAKGPLHKTTIRDAISAMQGGHCLLCNSGIEHYHHLVPRSQNGGDTLGNLVGLCNSCHGKVHTDEKIATKLERKAKGMHKKYHALSVLNQIIPSLVDELALILPLTVTTGRETKQLRDSLGIDKTHALDAFCIALSLVDHESLPICSEPVVQINMKQYRRHDRQVTHQEMLNRPYKLGKDTVCYNRSKAYEQKKPCLKDMPKSLIPFLKPQKHEKIDKRLDRSLPGSYIKGAGVMRGSTGSPGTANHYLKTESNSSVKANKAVFSYENTGLVFLLVYQNQ